MNKHPNYVDYLADENGGVFSLKTNRYLKPNDNGQGYLTVMLKNLQGVWKRVSVHRFIAESFYGFSKLVVNHIDGDKKNNCLSNLEFCTQKENINHSWEIGLCNHLPQLRSLNQKNKIGHKHHRSKKVRNTETNEVYECIREASEKNNIKKSTLVNQLKKNLTTKFIYEP
jgi:hypothetical protein